MTARVRVNQSESVHSKVNQEHYHTCNIHDVVTYNNIFNNRNRIMKNPFFHMQYKQDIYCAHYFNIILQILTCKMNAPVVNQHFYYNDL